MTSFNDVTNVCSTILVGKPLHMHRRTAMIHLHTCQHPHQITVYYRSLESRRLFSEPIFMPVTLIYIYYGDLVSYIVFHFMIEKDKDIP